MFTIYNQLGILSKPDEYGNYTENKSDNDHKNGQSKKLPWFIIN